MRHILVIDDDPLFRTLVEGTLRTRYKVETAADGHAAFQAALERPPALIVLDLLMPRWDGVQTLRAFRSDETLARVPVVILTGVEDEPEVAEIRNSGVAKLLAKTAFSREGLLSGVAEALSNRTRFRPRGLSPGAIPVAAQRFDS